MSKFLIRRLLFLGILTSFLSIHIDTTFSKLVKVNASTVKPQRLEKKVAEIPEEKITLNASEAQGAYGTYLTNFKLYIDNTRYTFPWWRNVTNQTYYPELSYTDLTNDKLKEVIIILTTGYGSDNVFQEAHVLNRYPDGLVEKLVDNPMAIINKNIKSGLTDSEATIYINNKLHKIDIKKFNLAPNHIYPEIAFGSVIEYKIINNKLNGIVSATISPLGGYLGNIVITYAFKDNMYQAEKISFEEGNE